MSFKVENNNEIYRIYYGDRQIACGDRNFGFGVLKDVVVHADKEPLMSFHQIAPTEFGHVDNPPDIQCQDNEVLITLCCENEDVSLRLLTKVKVMFCAEKNAFEWDCSHETEVLKPYKITMHFPRTDVDSEFADTGAWVFEIANPMPAKASAPKDGPIPVDRTDIIYPQPWYSKGGWEKNWRFFAFTRQDGQTVRIPLNHLDNHDKDFWRQAANGSLYLLGGNGTNIRYRFLEDSAENICHHYCMWGYDLHFFEIIAKGSGENENQNPVLKTNRKLYHHYVLEAMTDVESEQVLTSAIEHPWRERDQKRLENTPRYNPGLNYFNRQLGRQDDGGFFEPASICQYLPHHPGRTEPGVILIETGHFDFDGNSLYNAWNIALGSDNWHTPIESGEVYEISVWARLESGLNEKSKARIAFKYVQQFNQATPEFRTETSDAFYSNEITGKTGWTKLVLRTPQLPDNYISLFRISLELHGRGTCYFDEFECKQSNIRRIKI